MAFTPDEINRILEPYGRKANKALGQNFCTDTDLLASAVEKTEICGLPVIEIGPGLGALTVELVKHSPSVTVIEKDAFLAELLSQIVQESNLTVICGDALKTDFRSLMSGQDTVIVGNLPYYITTPLIQKVLPLLPAKCLLMVQKEASDRFFAKPKDRVYGPTAILTQTYFEPLLFADVSRDRFYPQPEVDSAMVILNRRAGHASLPDPYAFFRFILSAFSMRRKTLRNNFPKDSGLSGALAALGLPVDCRAEDLEPSDFTALYRKLHS